MKLMCKHHFSILTIHICGLIPVMTKAPRCNMCNELNRFDTLIYKRQRDSIVTHIYRYRGLQALKRSVVLDRILCKRHVSL